MITIKSHVNYRRTREGSGDVDRSPSVADTERPGPGLAPAPPRVPTTPDRGPADIPANAPGSVPVGVPINVPANDDDADAVREVPLAVPFVGSCDGGDERPACPAKRGDPAERVRMRRERGKHTIYALIDPRCGAVAYVGETRRLKGRKAEHRQSAAVPVAAVVAETIAAIDAQVPVRVPARGKGRRKGRLTPIRRALLERRVALERVAAMTPDERARASRADTDTLPRSVKLWLACMGEGGHVPVFVVLDTARGERASHLKETVWVQRFARAGAKLHNRNLNQHGIVRDLRRELAAGNGPTDGNGAGENGSCASENGDDDGAGRVGPRARAGAKLGAKVGAKAGVNGASGPIDEVWLERLLVEAERRPTP